MNPERLSASMHSHTYERHVELRRAVTEDAPQPTPLAGDVMAKPQTSLRSARETVKMPPVLCPAEEGSLLVQVANVCS
ncbi:MAG TPA: hypothetical protein DDW52_29670 [Planctomycetaceae bacterium]|nr:hypothetical protein [Planctomycetaceae bacterium]